MNIPKQKTYRPWWTYPIGGLLFIVVIVTSIEIASFLRFPLSFQIQWQIYILLFCLLCLCLFYALRLVRIRLTISPKGILYCGPTYTKVGLGGPFCTIYTNWDNIVEIVFLEWFERGVIGFRLNQPVIQLLSVRKGIQSGQSFLKVTNRRSPYLKGYPFASFIPLSIFLVPSHSIEQTKWWEEIQKCAPQLSEQFLGTKRASE
jgi:hypothetical protein